MTKQYLTLKSLQQETNAPIYVVQYLKACNRLPIAKPSRGRGYPTLYDPSAVEVIEEHLSKRHS